GGASLWVMSGKTNNVYKGVAKFLAFLSRPEVQMDWHTSTGYVPITIAAYELTKKSGYYEKNPGADVPVRQLMNKPPTAKSKCLPYLLVAPQIAVTVVFFLWPAGQAVYYAFLEQDPFGLSNHFVWFRNFQDLFHNENYLESFKVTALFSALVAFIGIALSLLLATMADRVLRGALAYKTLLIWPYAVAPAIAGVLWAFLFAPSIGLIPYYLKRFGIDWNWRIN